uniref:Uncharacterized protein n=1 Tax=Panagrolaimus sp. JU765 TaxID=591449 RepID=A0AC34RAC3_9BILA
MNTIYVNKLENRVYDMFYPFPQVWKAMELFPSSFENLEEAQNLLLEQEAIFKKKMKNKPRRGSVNDENNTSEDNQA